MHQDFADWYRVTTIEPHHDLLERRWAGIEIVLQEFDAAGLLDLTRLVYDLPRSNPTTIDRLRAAFKQADSAFPMRNNDTELRILAASALMQQMTTHNSTPSNVVALGTICADGHGFGRRPILDELPEAARIYVAREAVEARAPATIPAVVGPASQTRMLIETLKTQCAQNQTSVIAESLGASLTALDQSIDALAQSAQKAIHAFIGMVEVQQEETNILWWVFGGYSRDLKEPIRALGSRAACVVVAKELADLTAILPGPSAAEAILDRVLHYDECALPEVTIVEVVEGASRDWRESWIGAYESLRHDGLFPLVAGIVESVETDVPGGWVAVYERISSISPSQPIPLLCAASQLYYELLLARAIGLG